MNERFKQVRLALGLSQEDFGIKLHFKKGHVSQLEKGVKKITERTVDDVCREYNVNKTWLFTGNGEMFNPNSNELLFELQNKYNMGEVFRNAVLVYIQANELERKVIDDFLQKIVKEANGNQEAG